MSYSRLKRKVFISLPGVFVFIFFFQWSATSIHEYAAQVHSEYSYQAKLDLPELNETLNNLLYRHGYIEADQGVLIESLDSGLQIASLNADKLFNPASTLKLATSLAALEKWGPNHRFQTTFYFDGSIDTWSNTLYGDLILYSEGDPTIRLRTLNPAVSQLKKMGVRKITGNFIINGPFTIDANSNRNRAARKTRQYLKRRGIYIEGETLYENKTGVQLISNYSSPLSDIVWHQNAHSSNPIAERLGESLGGTDMLTIHLFQKIGIPINDFFITHSSGLDYNRITPRAMLKILRRIVRWCAENDVAVDKILPVAGVDASTVRLRFTMDGCRGGVLAKTGTLLVTDDGVSALAGLIYTRKYGIILFSLFNSRGDVFTFQRWQNNFLQKVIKRCGGVQPVRLDAYNTPCIFNKKQWFYDHEQIDFAEK